MIVEWGKAAPTPLHGLRMFMTIGVIIAPPITIPFLSNTKTNHTMTHVELSEGLVMDGNETAAYTGHVQFAYAILGSWSVVVSIMFLIFFLHGTPYANTGKPTNKTNVKDILNPATIAGGNFKYGLYFLIFLFLLYVLLHGRDRGIGTFLFVIAHIDVQMTKPVAALLVSMLNVFIALGRGFVAFLAHWLPIESLLFTQVVATVVLQLLMYFYGVESIVALWTLTALYGLSAGPTFPSMMSWASKYIETTGMVLAIIDIGNGVGGFLALWFYGVIHEDYGSSGVFLMGLINGTVIIVLLIPLQIVSLIHGKSHKNNAEQSRCNVTNASIQACPESDEVDDNTPLLRDK